MKWARAPAVAVLALALRLGAAGAARVRRAGNASGEAIPNVIYFTGPWDPKQVVEASSEVLAKGTEFRYYNYSELDRSVEEVSLLLEREAAVHNVSKAFHNLRPRAFRSDLWRYMILWQNGGVYLDAKLTLRAPLSSWVDQSKDSLAVCWDRGKSTYWTAMVAARRRDPTLLTIIKQIVSNVQAHYYGAYSHGGHADLEITGPGMLTQVLLREKPAGLRASCKLQVSSAWKSIPSESKVVDVSDLGKKGHKKRRVIADVDEGTHGAMRSCKHCDSYGQLYERHQVYCDERGPRCRFSFLASSRSGAPRPLPRYLSWVV